MTQIGVLLFFSQCLRVLGKYVTNVSFLPLHVKDVCKLSFSCIGDEEPSSEISGPYTNRLMFACPTWYWEKLYMKFEDVPADCMCDVDEETNSSDALGLDRFSTAVISARNCLDSISTENIVVCITAIQKFPNEALSENQLPWVANLLVEGMNLNSVAALLDDGQLEAFCWEFSVQRMLIEFRTLLQEQFW